MKAIKFLTVFTLAAILISCTKEVPENAKKAIKTADDVSITKTIDEFFTCYNSNNIDSLTYYLDSEYKGFIPDSDDAVGALSTINDLKQYRKRYPDGLWQYKIEEINVGGDIAEVLTTASFMRPGPVSGKLNPIYSERSIRILRRAKDDGWKIYRYIAIPTFSYDS